jgi:hypothetical protein
MSKCRAIEKFVSNTEYLSLILVMHKKVKLVHVQSPYYYFKFISPVDLQVHIIPYLTQQKFTQLELEP